IPLATLEGMYERTITISGLENVRRHRLALRLCVRAGTLRHRAAHRARFHDDLRACAPATRRCDGDGTAGSILSSTYSRVHRPPCANDGDPGRARLPCPTARGRLLRDERFQRLGL